MAYSIVGIANLALGRIGVAEIASLTEDSPAAVRANLTLQYVRDLVLEARDWRFAKVRVALAQSTTTPASRYLFAYPLPTDFIKIPKDIVNDPSVFPSGTTEVVREDGLILSRDINFPYIFEALPDGTECIFSDYDNSSADLFLVYIRRVTTPSKYTAHFVDSFAFRWAAEMAPKLTASTKKFEDMMFLYDASLVKAAGLNQSLDSLKDELGSNSWVGAGR